MPLRVNAANRLRPNAPPFWHTKLMVPVPWASRVIHQQFTAIEQSFNYGPRKPLTSTPRASSFSTDHGFIEGLALLL